GTQGEHAPATSVVSLSSGGPTATVTVASNGASPEFAWRLVPITDPPSAPGSWSAWSSNPVMSLSALNRGTYELFVHSRHAANAAGVLVEESDPLELGVRVDGAGDVFVRK